MDHIVFTATLCIKLACSPVEVKVWDGDTAWIAGVKYRLASIDAPEIDARCPEERRVGEKAKRRLAALLSSGPIEIKAGEKDRYGRVLADITAAGSSVGDALASEALAAPWAGHKHPWCRP
jgi:micrococcal nuclease